MPKLEFGDFYKFLVSIGIILIAISLILPWLLVQESYEPVLSDEEFNELQIQTQELLLKRNSIALWVLNHVVCLMTLFFCLGLFLFYLGSRFWYDRQKIRDENEDIDHFKKVENLGNASLLEKADEINEDISADTAFEKRGEKYAYYNFRKHLSIEKTIISQIKRKLSDTYTVFTDKRIDNKILDAVLVANSIQHIDIIIDFKQLTNISSTVIEKSIVNIQEERDKYNFEIKHSVAGLLLLIVSFGSDLTDLELNNFINSCYYDYPEIKNKVFIEFIREKSISDFDFYTLMNKIQATYS